MIPKKQRVPVQSFPRIAHNAVRGRFFVAKTAPNGLPYNRVGVLITKKYSKKAVDRNRLRRAIFDLFRLESDFLTKKNAAGEEGKDLLIIVNHSMILKGSDEVIKELTHHVSTF